MPAEKPDRDMILVISHSADVHATTVVDCLNARNETVRILDLSNVPNATSVSIDYAPPHEPSMILTQAGQGDLDLADCRSIWWRRPQLYDLSAIGDQEAHAFAYNEWHEAFAGLWQLSKAFWVNDPVRDEVASHKAFQLSEAAAVGLKVPRTLITSDPTAATKFLKEVGVGKTVFKLFSATEHTWRETRVIQHDELDRIDDVRLAPVIFQEYIEADVDLRVTIVGERVFPAAIFSQETNYQADFRMNIDTVRIEPTDLPDPITDQLRALMKRLHLVYGAVDMRRTKGGEHVFLEVNTAGQWLFVEEATKQPITEAVADALATASPPQP